MKFEPEQIPTGSLPFFQDAAGAHWVPLYSHACTFGPSIFTENMMNLINNPNLNSSWLFRADILHDSQSNQGSDTENSTETKPITNEIKGMTLQRTLVRRLIPRSERRDKPMEQTCSFHHSQDPSFLQSILVIYTPHAPSAEDIPFYHPKVKGIAHLHAWDPTTNTGTISVHFLPYPEHPATDVKLQRIAYHLLEIIHKHGHGAADGYVKRVHHDAVIPQQRFQDRYANLKSKYARQLIDTWAEKTDPTKHVFEDLGIAAFLIELWIEMYPKDAKEFPGFVDIGCGNGLLVYILTEEGYPGWGFDARERKSWAQYTTPSNLSPSGLSLEERLLLPKLALEDATDTDDLLQTPSNKIHDGSFPPGTFIVSNHADELTPWTSILATESKCPFIMIPCCSHNLTGEKFRAPPPRDKSKPKSTYASLVDWVSQIAEDCGWEVETEMLRIPSTRNTCLVGRRRTTEEEVGDVDVRALLQKYGGVQNFYDNIVKLLKSGASSH